MRKFKIALIILIALCVALAPAMVLAKKHHGDQPTGPSDSRVIWDIVWKFINFFILVYVIVRFGRKPLMGFLKTHSAEIGERLDQQKDLLQEAEAEYQETEGRLTKLEELVVEVEERIKVDAQRAKQSILEDAQRESSFLMSEAEERAKHIIEQAREGVKQELVEIAWQEAERLIREKIAVKDQNRLIKEYLSGLEGAVQV